MLEGYCYMKCDATQKQVSEEHAASECISSIFYPEDGGRRFFRKSVASLTDDAVKYPKIQ
jgi:hypothetical protein